MKNILETIAIFALAALGFLVMLLAVIVFYLSLPFIILAYGILTILEIVLK